MAHARVRAPPGTQDTEIYQQTQMLQIISVLLENKPGALLRVTGLLSARGYNIESLTVARTVDPELSRMTIVVDVDDKLRAQVIKQMNKLINVLQAADLTDSAAVCREMVLLRVRATQESRTSVLKEAEIFGARVVDSSTEGFALEVTGESEKLDEFISRNAKLRRYRGHPFGRRRGIARNQETAPATACSDAGRRQIRRGGIEWLDGFTKTTATSPCCRAARWRSSAMAARGMLTL